MKLLRSSRQVRDHRFAEIEHVVVAANRKVDAATPEGWCAEFGAVAVGKRAQEFGNMCELVHGLLVKQKRRSGFGVACEGQPDAAREVEGSHSVSPGGKWKKWGAGHEPMALERLGGICGIGVPALRGQLMRVTEWNLQCRSLVLLVARIFDRIASEIRS